MQHTDLPSLNLPYCDIYPLEHVTHIENGEHPAACNRVHFLKCLCSRMVGTEPLLPVVYPMGVGERGTAD